MGKTAGLSLLILCLSVFSLQAQTRINADTAVKRAILQNQQIGINTAEIKSARLNVKTANDLPKTGLFAENEDLRPSDAKGILKIGISQSIAWPGLYVARKNYLREQLKYAELNTEVLEAAITRDVRASYYQLWYLQDRQILLLGLDSIYTNLLKATTLRVRTGDVAKLDQIAADAKMKELQALIAQNQKDMVVQQQQLMILLNQNEWLLPVAARLEQIKISADSNTGHPLIDLQEQNVKIAAANVGVQRNNNRPEFSGRVFSQRLWGAPDPFTGFSVTASIPIFGISANRNRVKNAAAELEVEEKTLHYQAQVLNTQRQKALTEIEKHSALLSFYENWGLQQADEIIKAATLSYKAGEISFAELGQFLGQAIGIRQNYLEVLNTYNQSAIQYKYYNYQ